VVTAFVISIQLTNHAGDTKAVSTLDKERKDWFLEGLQLMAKLKEIDQNGAILEIAELDRLYFTLYGGQSQQIQIKATVGRVQKPGFRFKQSIGGSNYYGRIFLAQKYLGLGTQSLKSEDEIWGFSGVECS